jgi:diaminopimelate decarboxylase
MVILRARGRRLTLTVQIDMDASAPFLAEIGASFDKPLTISGVSAEELADIYGTPLYVFSGDCIEQRVRKVRQAFGAKIGISYAIKANHSLAVVRLMQQLGLGAEIASSGELVLADSVGYKGSNIQFAGPGKTAEEIRRALGLGVRINIESEPEYELIRTLAKAIGVVPTVAIRVNPPAVSSRTRITMAGGAKKFGVDSERVPSLVAKVQSDGVCHFVGLHCYVGTQIFDSTAWLSNARWLISYSNDLELKTGIAVGNINFGGGFGLDVFGTQETFDVEAAGSGLQMLHDSDSSEQSHERRFEIELGRYLVANSGVYLSRVLYVKSSYGHRYAVIDGGMHHNASAAGVGAILRRPFPMVIANNRAANGSTGPITIAGPLCTPLDEFANQIVLGDVRIGDLIAILGSGAYGLSFSPTGFLGHPTPAEVMVFSGNHWLARERGTDQDILRGQV